MKTVEGQRGNGDASALCENCHKDAMKNFPTSKHAGAGVTCVNCHLDFDCSKNYIEDIGESAPDHNFKPTIIRATNVMINACARTSRRGSLDQY
jgi:hypothetical protein